MKPLYVRQGNLKAAINPEYESLNSFLMSLPALFEEHRGEVLYAGRNEVRLFSENGLRLVAKRYKRVNAVQRVVYTFFRRTKAERAFTFAAILRERGVDTPKEVAYLEESHGGLFETGYFVSLECPYPPAFDRLVPPKDFDADLATKLSAFIVYMHSRGILHGDMNFGNFLYHFDDSDECHFTVIDTNRSHFCQGYPSREECLWNFRTTTHRRDVYRFMVAEYARLRGWNVEETVEEAIHCLEKFEHRHRFKDWIKKHRKQH